MIQIFLPSFMEQSSNFMSVFEPLMRKWFPNESCYINFRSRIEDRTLLDLTNNQDEPRLIIIHEDLLIPYIDFLKIEASTSLLTPQRTSDQNISTRVRIIITKVKMLKSHTYDIYDVGYFDNSTGPQYTPLTSLP